MTITQTVEIPENRRLIIDVPRDIPVKAIARFELVWTPETKKANDFRASLEKIRALCKDAPISVDGFLKERRRDNTIEESRYRQHFGDGN